MTNVTDITDELLDKEVLRLECEGFTTDDAMDMAILSMTLRRGQNLLALDELSRVSVNQDG